MMTILIVIVGFIVIFIIILIFNIPTIIMSILPAPKVLKVTVLNQISYPKMACHQA